MTDRQDVARGRDIVARWCNLAEQRLEHLTELFESGRWRRYHSEAAFLENIREAKAAVETWRNLLTREASRENYALDISWLGRARTTLPKDPQPRRVHPFSLQWDAFTAEPVRSAVPARPEAIRVAPVEARALPTVEAPAFEPEAQPVADMVPEPALQPELDSASALTLDIIASIQERYPLLRNRL
jgi:uncharacterized repeat protein (TIGR03809 family)